MESIVLFLSNLDIDIGAFLPYSGAFLLGILLLDTLSRLIFKKQTMLGHGLSSSIAIVFIYVVTVLLITIETDLQFLAAPLPFVSITQDSIRFFSFHANTYSVIAIQLLGMIILSFLVNLADSLLPRGKNLITWLLFRCLTVILGFFAHYVVTWLFQTFCPDFIIQYAPAVLLAILAVMLLTGALRVVVGLILTTVNPIIAALYTFFFANIIGTQITKAVLTTAILSGCILLLEKHSIATLSLIAGALVAYIPFILVLVPVWYVVSRP